MYVNDEPLVFSETFVPVVLALSLSIYLSDMRSSMVGWFYGRVLRPTGAPMLSPPPNVWVRNKAHTLVLENYTRGLIRYGRRRRFGMRRVAKYFWVFLPSHIIDMPRSSSGTRTVRAPNGEGRMIYESRIRPYIYKYEREVAAVVKNESYTLRWTGRAEIFAMFSMTQYTGRRNKQKKKQNEIYWENKNII